MKNACIVIRNKKEYYTGAEFEGALGALIDGGYYIDKVYILSREDSHEISQTFVECKNFFDNVFLFAPQSELGALRAKLGELLQAEQGAGSVFEAGKKTFFCYPFGKEGAGLVRGEAVPYLDKKYALQHARTVIRAVGVPRDRLRNLTERLRQSEGLSFHLCENNGELRTEVLYDSSSPKMAVDAAVRLVAEALDDFTYAVDDTPLNRRVYELLKLRGLKLSVAESFTGGGVASRLIEVSGASEVLFESVVAYDNESKISRLGVSGETLARFGAVSDETAYEMAAGLIATGNCSVSLATTGIAGPKSDGTGKPVGLCYIAVGTRETVYVYKYIFKGTREEITERAINQALFLLYKQIK